jgi:hypothetical protein
MQMSAVAPYEAPMSVIRTFCIYHQFPLLHDDRDFDPIVRFLGLQAVDT